MAILIAACPTEKWKIFCQWNYFWLHLCVYTYYMYNSHPNSWLDDRSFGLDSTFVLLKKYYIYQQNNEDLFLCVIQAHPCWPKPEQQHYHLWVFRRTWAARGLPGACGGQGPDCSSTTGRLGNQPDLSIWNEITASGQEVGVILYTPSYATGPLYITLYEAHIGLSVVPIILMVSVCADAVVLVSSQRFGQFSLFSTVRQFTLRPIKYSK